MKMINICLFALFSLTLESALFAACSQADLYCSARRYNDTKPEEFGEHVYSGTIPKMDKTFALKDRGSGWCDLMYDKEAEKAEAQQICADYAKSHPEHSNNVYPVIYKERYYPEIPFVGNEVFLKAFDPKS